MALVFAHGTITWSSADAVGTTYVQNTAHGGNFFQPKALLFYVVGLPNALPTSSSILPGRVCRGFAASATDRRCMGFLSVDAAAAADCQEIYRADAVIATVSAAGAVDGLLDLDSIGSQGFTLIVDDVTPQTMRVLWFAWGGDDIRNVATGEIVEPAATGVQSYSVTGWLPTALTDSAVLFAGCQLTAAAPTAAVQDAGLMFGFATGVGAGNQYVLLTNEDDGSANMDCDRYHRGDECLAMMTVAGGNPNARASFNGFDSAGFDLNWTARAVTNRRYIYMAIQGGSWRVGNFTLDTTGLNNTATAPTPFRPVGALLGTIGRLESTSATSNVEAQQAIGSFLGLGAAEVLTASYDSLDAAAATDLRLSASNTAMIRLLITATDCNIDINAINQDGFEAIVTAVGSASYFIGYLAFGDATLRPNSGQFPDIIHRGRRVVASGSRPPRSGA